VRITTLIAALLAAAFALPAVASAQVPIKTLACKDKAPIVTESAKDKQPKPEPAGKEKGNKYEPVDDKTAKQKQIETAAKEKSKDKPEPAGKDKADTVSECAAKPAKPGPELVNTPIVVVQNELQPVTNDRRVGTPAPKETDDTADQAQQVNEAFDRLMDLLNQMHNTRNQTAGRVAG
jgi:hypothetical protein